MNITLTQYVDDKIQSFCDKHSLKKEVQKITNIYSEIVLSNAKIRITFSIEKMESYVQVVLEILDADGQIEKKELISDNYKEIMTLRKKALHSWRKTTREKYLSQMLDKYLSVIEGFIA